MQVACGWGARGGLQRSVRAGTRASEPGWPTFWSGVVRRAAGDQEVCEQTGVQRWGVSVVMGRAYGDGACGQARAWWGEQDMRVAAGRACSGGVSRTGNDAAYNHPPAYAPRTSRATGCTQQACIPAGARQT